MALDANLTINALDLDHGAYSSTYSASLTFKAWDLPVWLKSDPKVSQVQLLPFLSLGQLMMHSKTVVTLRRYRRDPWKYCLRIWNEDYPNYAFFFKGIYWRNKANRGLWSAHTYEQVFRHLVAHHYIVKRGPIPAIDKSEVHRKVEEKKVSIDLETFEPKVIETRTIRMIDEFTTQQLLDEVVERYKKELGPKWKDVFIPPPAEVIPIRENVG